MISENGEGVLGFITNHGYLDNPTFRGMRWHLLTNFDKIWIIDLHGSTKKSEIAPSGVSDKNVFDILPGVAIIIATRKRSNKKVRPLGKVMHGDIWGGRAAKGEVLAKSLPADLATTELPEKAPQYALVPMDYAQEAGYAAGFSLTHLFPLSGTGLLSARDTFSVDMDRAVLWDRASDTLRMDVEAAREKYAVGNDTQSWSLAAAIDDLKNNATPDDIIELDYRPLDRRWTIYTGVQGGFHFFPASKISRNLVGHQNLSICYTRKIEGGRPFADVLVTTGPITLHSLSIKEVNSFAPLYLYPDNELEQRDAFEADRRTLNLDTKLYTAICTAAGIDIADQAGPDDDFRAATGEARPSEVKVFDYIYGVLHSPAYREKFSAFLKIGFPRVPYPASPEVFAHVSEKGEQLRRLHLMEPPAIGDTPFPYHGEGDDVVASGYPKFADGRVHINPNQYFDAVPPIAWDFHIGGYQPAQKWLKDRRGRSLSWDDIGDYEKVVKILAETDRIMKEIELRLD